MKIWKYLKFVLQIVKKALFTQAKWNLEKAFFNSKVERHDLSKRTEHLYSIETTQSTQLSKQQCLFILLLKMSKIKDFWCNFTIFVVFLWNWRPTCSNWGTDTKRCCFGVKKGPKNWKLLNLKHNSWISLIGWNSEILMIQNI